MQIKRKIPTFVFGLSIGLIIGVGFFVFKITDIFNTLKNSAKEQITVIEQPVKNSSEEEKENQKNKERFKINLGNSTKINYKEVDSLIKQDSELNVATDELLSVKNVKVIKIGDTNSGSDTLAANLAGVKENSTNLYFIEFWKTPLNSKGYRFTKNKVMMYGFIDFNNVVLYELENSYYIKCSDQVFKLFYGSDFKPLERVVDTDLLAKIN
ncbi:MAG: hypothetical protein SFY56_10370 [Bacteroidota bacterium]|nr:hypothetical protein [Bacteroidota bacterium]